MCCRLNNTCTVTMVMCRKMYNTYGYVLPYKTYKTRLYKNMYFDSGYALQTVFLGVAGCTTPVL